MVSSVSRTSDPAAGQSLADCLPAVDGDWCAGLVDPAARARLAEVAETLPAALLHHQLGFESDLGDGARRVDLLVALTEGRDGAALLGRMAAAADPDDPVWGSVAELGELWASSDWSGRLDDVWLEFDVHGPRPRSPSLFVGPRLPVTDRAAWQDWLDRVAPVLLGRPPSAELAAGLHRCRESLPTGAHIFQIGAMRSRPVADGPAGGPTLRLCLNQLYLDLILRLLPALGIDQGERLTESFIALQRHADGFAVQIDVPFPATGEPPRLGLECYLDERVRPRPLAERWDAFLGWLEELGLATAAKRQALRRYPGRVLAAERPETWPARLLSLESRLAGQSSLRRWIHHVKLDFAGGLPVRAKAYLSVGHEWTSAA